MSPSDVLNERYRLERLLGTGGMSEVWLAEDMRLGRWVAVKVLRQIGADGELAGGLQAEARIIARLQHPNIVAVYDAGEFEGNHYLVMEYVHGYSIRQLLETQGRFTETEAVLYAKQVAEALAYAHLQGVMHCDIKPENILVNEHGVAKVADFGVAETVTRTLTPQQAREVMGTVAYLAPEVLQGSAATPASDVYSLALMVYEMVAGRLPFAGATPAATAGQRLASSPPPLRSFAMSASPELEGTLARALSRSPLDRPQTASEFAAALSRVPQRTAGGRPPAVAPPGRPPRALEPRRRNPTARVRASGPPPPRSNPGFLALALIGAGLVAVGAGTVVGIVLATRGGDSGGGNTPTPAPSLSPVVSPTVPGTPTRLATATPTNEPTLTPTPQATPTATPGTPTRTPTVGPTPTRTVGPSASPSPQGNQTVTASPTVRP